MDTRLKERLVGAIVLVAIVVIVVPELLTGQRSARAPTSAPGSVPVRTVTIDLATPERAAIEHPALAASAPAAPPSAPAATAPAEARAAPDSTAAPDARTPESAAATTVEPVATPAPTPAPPPAATVQPPATAALRSAHATAAAPASPPRPSAVAHGGEAWVVQLGSFASRDNAERLAANLRAKSYSAFVSEFRGSGRVLFRVRVGPEQDRARADAIAARLAREGHRGSVAPAS